MCECAGLAQRGPQPARKVLAQVMSYEYLFQALREKGGAYGAGMLNRAAYELFYTYRDPHAAGSYRRFAEGPAAVAGWSLGLRR